MCIRDRLRVNPVVGAGSIAIISTATKLSKFGLPLTDETRGRIIGLYKKYEWLNGIHFHVGSQGCAMDLFVKAAEVSSNKKYRRHIFAIAIIACHYKN